MSLYVPCLRGSSTVEQAAVTRKVIGSTPICAVSYTYLYHLRTVVCRGVSGDAFSKRREPITTHFHGYNYPFSYL